MPRKPSAQRDLNLPERSFFFEDLVGGVDLVSAPTAMAPGKAQEVLNFSLQEAGALVTTEGWRTFTASALTPSGTNRIQGAVRSYLDSTPLTLVAFEGDLYPVSDAGVFGSPIGLTLNDANEVFFPYSSRVLLVMDGASRPKITTDGATFYDAGIDAPGTAPTLGQASGGSLLNNNTYQVSYTYGTTSAVHLNLVHESNGSPTTNILLSGATLTITVEGPSSSDPKVNVVHVYARNLTTGQTLRRRVATTANGGTWSTSFNTEPSELAFAEPVDNGVPGNFRFGLFWQNRFWALDPTVPNRLHFSQLFQPQAWPEDFYLDLPLVSGDSLSTLVPLGELLVLFTKLSPSLLSMPSVLEIDTRQALSAETGAFGPRAAVAVESGVVHVGAPGICLFNGAQDRLLSPDLQTGWRDLTQNATPAQLAAVSVMYRPQPGQVVVGVPRLYPFGTAGEYVLDLTRTTARQSPAWFRTSRPARGYLTWAGNEPLTGNQGRVFSWAASVGRLYEERVGTDADGSNLSAIFTTPSHHTQFRETMLVNGFVEFQPAEGILTVDLMVNGLPVSTQVLSTQISVARYGTAVYGTSTYGGSGRQKRSLSFPLPADGTEFFLRFSFSGSTRFRLLSYGVGTVPEPVIRTLS